MKTHALAMMLAAINSAGCLHPGPVQKTFARPYPERDAAGSPILASFVGRIPCAVPACEMRKVEVVFYAGAGGTAPTTYWLGQVGVGLGDELEVRTGTWIERRSVRGYPEAIVYELDAGADASLRQLWRVTDDILLVLDHSQPKAGNGAWGNMLSRDPAPYGPRSYRYDERTRRFIGAATLDPSPVPQ